MFFNRLIIRNTFVSHYRKSSEEDFPRVDLQNLLIITDKANAKVMILLQQNKTWREPGKKCHAQEEKKEKKSWRRTGSEGGSGIAVVKGGEKPWKTKCIRNGHR
jgi:hypothetical protein